MSIVLVVDDEVIICALLAEALTDEGYDVVTAYTGLDGMRELHDACPHLIISDYMMPGLDGIAFLNALREHSTCRHVPFILMSALPPARFQQLLPECSALITKPFKLDAVVALVTHVLRPRI